MVDIQTRPLICANCVANMVYFILESYEGICSYSTLAFKTGDAYRDLELRIPPDMIQEVDEVLKSLGELIYEISIPE